MYQNALQFNDLSQHAAEVADLSLIVRARFVEAADTMVHLDVRGVRPDRMRSLWPDVLPEPGTMRIFVSAIARARRLSAVRRRCCRAGC